jgi:hypothetical protein
MVELLELTTLRATPPSVTLGVRVPKPVPVTVICVPAVFSATCETMGTELFAAAMTAVGVASNNARAKRGNMIYLFVPVRWQ